MRTAPFLMLFPVLSTAACGGLGAPRPEDVQVVLALAAVPADVGCVRVTAAGSGRTVTRELDVTPGTSLDEPFSGLPLGTVSFSADGFAAGCGAVTKATVPAWVSDTQVASVSLTRIATVELTLHRNGRAKVNVDFADEPMCSPGGAACLHATECCSHQCLHGACAGADGGADAPLAR